MTPEERAAAIVDYTMFDMNDDVDSAQREDMRREITEAIHAAIAEERKAFAVYLETIGCWHSPKDADEFRALAPDQPIPGWKA